MRSGVSQSAAEGRCCEALPLRRSMLTHPFIPEACFCGKSTESARSEDNCRPPLAENTACRTNKSPSPARYAAKTTLPLHLSRENLPPEIALLHDKMSAHNPSDDRQEAGNGTADAALDGTTDTAHDDTADAARAVADAGAVFDAVSQLHVQKAGMSKPRVDGWTFNKDMALLGAWYTFLRGGSKLQQVPTVHHHPALPLTSHASRHASCSCAHHPRLTSDVHCVQVDGRSERKMLDRLGVLRKAIKEQVGKVRVKHLLPTARDPQVIDNTRRRTRPNTSHLC